MPEAAPSTLGFCLRNHSTKHQLSAPPTAEKCVAAQALVASVPAVSALPALNPNQPTHNSPVPMSESTRLCGSIGSCPKPARLPSMMAQIKAETPELMCTHQHPGVVAEVDFRIGLASGLELLEAGETLLHRGAVIRARGSGGENEDGQNASPEDRQGRELAREFPGGRVIEQAIRIASIMPTKKAAAAKATAARKLADET